MSAIRSGHIGGLVLAAGLSRRMGRNKLALPIYGEAMLNHAVRAALDAGLMPVILVVGPASPSPPEGPITVVCNPTPEAGLAGSLIAGLRAMPDDIEALVVLLADMPLVGARHVARLIEAVQPPLSLAQSICVPVWNGRRGNPVLLGRAFFAELLLLQGDVGARPVIGRHPEAVVEVPVDDAAVTIDVDDAEDLAQLPASRPFT